MKLFQSLHLPKKYFYFLFIILLISLFSRTYLLNIIPTGMSDDEINFPLVSRSYFLTGKDLTEQWSPLSLRKPPRTVNVPYGTTPYIMFSPYFGSVQFSMFTARIPYAIFGSIFVVILFLIGLKLFSPPIAIIISFIYAINPWSLFFSRTAYESPIGLYFAFMMFALLLYSKSWRILLAIPLYIFSFYSYMGIQLVLPLFTTLIVFYCWIINKKFYTKYYVSIIIIIFIILGFFIFRLPNTVGGNRSALLLNPNMGIFSKEVNWSRRESIMTGLSSIFINKYNSAFQLFSSQYLKSFSPSYLFLNADDQLRFSIVNQGRFYLIDIVFFILGFFYLYSHRQKQMFLLLGILLIAPLPAALFVGDTQFALRSAFLFPTMIFMIGNGIYFLISKFKHIYIPVIVLVAIYAVSFVNFGYNYIYRNPISNYDSFGISGRIISHYIELAKRHGHDIQIISNGPNLGLYKQYLFFSNKYNASNHAMIAISFTQKDIKIDNVIFNSCEDFIDNDQIITIIPFGFYCPKLKIPTNILQITNFTDNQPIYTVYNDHVCNNYPYSDYMSDIKLADFDFSKIDEPRFCYKFFTRVKDSLTPTTTPTPTPAPYN
jgi:hypothetical protein